MVKLFIKKINFLSSFISLFIHAILNRKTLYLILQRHLLETLRCLYIYLHYALVYNLFFPLTIRIGFRLIFSHRLYSFNTIYYLEQSIFFRKGRLLTLQSSRRDVFISKILSVGFLTFYPRSGDRTSLRSKQLWFCWKKFKKLFFSKLY